MTEARTPAAEGGCQCGAVRYAMYVTPQKAHACHCRMCQRAVGGLFAVFVGAPPADFAWTKGAPAIFASSNIAKRGFCAACGTPLSFAGTYPESKRIYVTIGSLDHPERTPIAEHAGMESHIPWVHFNEDLPQRRTGEGYDADAAAAFAARIRSNQA